MILIFQVDVCTREKVAAFCSSDEDEEDLSSLQFLPIAPEVEDPEDGWQGTGPPDYNVEKERESKENTSPPVKKKKFKSYDVKLDGPPCEGVLKVENISAWLIFLKYVIICCFFLKFQKLTHYQFSGDRKKKLFLGKSL